MYANASICSFYLSSPLSMLSRSVPIPDPRETDFSAHDQMCEQNPWSAHSTGQNVAMFYLFHPSVMQSIPPLPGTRFTYLIRIRCPSPIPHATILPRHPPVQDLPNQVPRVSLHSSTLQSPPKSRPALSVRTAHYSIALCVCSVSAYELLITPSINPTFPTSEYTILSHSNFG